MIDALVVTPFFDLNQRKKKKTGQGRHRLGPGPRRQPLALVDQARRQAGHALWQAREERYAWVFSFFDFSKEKARKTRGGKKRQKNSN